MAHLSQRFYRSITPVFLVAAALAIAIATLPWPQDQAAWAADTQISNAQFVRYIDDWSEPEGYFDTDNFISNETSYLHVIGELRSRVRPGGVYLGVGPDQNFSYIAQTQPALAIIVDIRRQNMLELLWYKALFELSSSRAEFLAMMFCRKTPDVPPNAGLPAIMRAIRASATQPGAFEKNLAAVKRLLTVNHALKLSADDLAKIQYVYDAFRREGPGLRFSTIGRVSSVWYPTYEDLLLQTDLDGKLQSYLSTEAVFQWMKRFNSENRLIPIVGDFGGNRAFKMVAAYLAANALKVSTFYTSNVEFYLFGGPDWASYVRNVRALPIAPGAVFIRSYFATNGPPHPRNVPGHRPTSLVQDFATFLTNADRGRLQTYWDVVKP